MIYYLQNLCKQKAPILSRARRRWLSLQCSAVRSFFDTAAFTFSPCPFLSPPAHWRCCEQSSPAQDTVKSFSSVGTEDMQKSLNEHTTTHYLNSTPFFKYLAVI